MSNALDPSNMPWPEENTIDIGRALVEKHLAQDRRTRGFTLIEMAIVVAVIGILAAIALPQYQRQVRQSRRTAAKTTLLDVASREEKYYATQNGYASLPTLAYSSSSVPVPSATQDYYNVTLTLGTPTNGYTATATPQGDQTKDTCGTYSITNLGVQSVTGADSNCW